MPRPRRGQGEPASNFRGREAVFTSFFCLQWNQGETLFKFLRNVSVPQKDGGPPIEFHTDGSMKSVQMIIVNLQMERETDESNEGGGVKRWEEIGVWQGASFEEKEDDVTDTPSTVSVSSGKR